MLFLMFVVRILLFSDVLRNWSGSGRLSLSELNREVMGKDTVGPKAINVFFQISIVGLVDVFILK